MQVRAYSNRNLQSEVTVQLQIGRRTKKAAGCE